MSLRKRFKNSLAELNDEDLLEEDEELQVIISLLNFDTAF